VAPLLALDFSEGQGTNTLNTGTAATGATGGLLVNNAFPAFTTNSPAGLFAATGNPSALDFGPVTATDTQRGVDFAEPVAMATEGLTSLTITGWLNIRSATTGSGGNRILSTLIVGESAGFDLVQDGLMLRLGINDYADRGTPSAPRSTARLTVDPAISASNWMFFAVAYDSDAGGAVSFFFGTPGAKTTLDRSAPYDRGPVKPPAQHRLTVGNFTAMTSYRTSTGDSSRILRGAVDGLRVFGRALTLDELRCVQAS
jgi:hypothetical protein